MSFNRADTEGLTNPGHGGCPACDAQGNPGDPCASDFCRKRGYHFLPMIYYLKICEIPHQARDQNMGLVFTDFLIADQVGKGGFGTVYLSLQLPLMMKTAMKLMSPSTSDTVMLDGLLKKFEGEARSLARLNHPNIVRLIKYGSVNMQPYMVMEYVDNARTLKDEITTRIMQGGNFEAPVIRHILEQMLNGLESAHQRRIIHRDIKPENIMLQRVTGDDVFVKILDFGLAKFLKHGDETSMMIGTPNYMAPEQLARKNIGPWTDLYALGVVAYEMLTGRRAFAGRTTQEVLAQKLNPEFDPVARLADLNLPELVTGFLSRAIARDVSDRLQSAATFREALGRAFDALKKGDATGDLTHGDLLGLLDSSDLERLRAEKAFMHSERGRLEAEQRRIDGERKELEKLMDAYHAIRESAPQLASRMSAPMPSGPTPSAAAPGAAQAPATGPQGGDGPGSGETPRKYVSQPSWISGPMPGIDTFETAQLESPRAGTSGLVWKVGLGLFLLLVASVGLLLVLRDPAGKDDTKTRPKPLIPPSGTPSDSRPRAPKAHLTHPIAPTVQLKPSRPTVTPRRPATTRRLPPASAKKVLEIVPVYYSTKGKEVVDRVEITINGKALGKTMRSRGLRFSFRADVPSYRITLSGDAIQHVSKTVRFSELPTSRLEIRVQLNLGL